MQEQRLVCRCPRLHCRDAVKDGLGIDASIVLDGPKSLLMPIEELQCGAGSNDHLIKARRDQVALTDSVDEAQQLSGVGAANDP